MPPDGDPELDLLIAAVMGLRARIAPMVIRRIESRAGEAGGLADRLTFSQRLVLSALGDGPLTVSELASATGVGLSSATRMAQRLGRMGLVERADPGGDDDGRRRYIGLTALGRATAAESRALLSARLRELLGPLSDRGRRDVLAGMEAVVEALQLAEDASRIATNSASDGPGGDSGVGSSQRMPSRITPR